jgi:YdjC-like protein
LHQSQTNRLLGYPADARLLIVNADDFGMCHSVNEAVFRALQQGLLRSTTLMVPCPWALYAMRFLADHPEFSFGVHLTAISDWFDYRWGPVTPREKVIATGTNILSDGKRSNARSGLHDRPLLQGRGDLAGAEP